MSTSSTDQGYTYPGDHPGQIAHHARMASEAIRMINHSTIDRQESVTDMDSILRTVASLEEMAWRLGQGFRKLETWTALRREGGTLNPVKDAYDLRDEMQIAAVLSAQLAECLDRAHQAAACLILSSPDGHLIDDTN